MAPELIGRLIDRGNAFAAGVFLGAGFIHMLPEAQKAWESLGWRYPMAFLVAVAVVQIMQTIATRFLRPKDQPRPTA